MFKKILIANRGEIACRVMKTAKAMGIKTVAVYSEADRDARHVKMADEAVLLGPPPAAESYLLIDKIVAACKDTGAEAVHPGYGFLSERAEFPEALAKAGVKFIGPPPNAIRAMGDKIESKKLASKAGVSTVPGFLGVIKGDKEAVKIAEEIGYPVMIKASAGGGGKGMRVAYSRQEVIEGFSASMNEARNSFGDDRVFIEKFVETPRHIEIQVLGDQKGSVIYLGERECSIQRRNQKVIEEAPSPFLDEETRRAMGEQSVALSQAVGYHSAGTVEFIVDKDRNFYFLEMNTRLQVEHPVTELITGVDLVEQMIRVAAGEPLSLAQKDVKLDGWAIESRLYAEDPYRNFLPSIGRLTRYRPPEEGDDGHGAIVRNDTGVEEGSEISMFYDPMIAKLCSWARDRDAAVAAQARALDAFQVEGIGHNLPFLAAVMDHGRFQSGEISTAFIAEEYPEGFQGMPLDDAARARLAEAATAITLRFEARRRRLSGRLRATPPPLETKWTVAIDGHDIDVELLGAGGVEEGVFSFVKGAAQRDPQDGEGLETTLTLDWRPGDRLAKAQFPSGEMIIKVEPTLQGWRLRWRGADVQAMVRNRRAAELAGLMPVKTPPDTSKLLLCPMPGLVVRIDVGVGDEVQEGQALAVVEAMKMENILRAERKSTVKAVNAEPGQSLAVDEVIMEFE
ncbi:MAG: acetyl/propionyl/methylcrotonyl-CoA carboxylase subunit alpha [Pseudomonadota bacterium]